MARYDSQKEEIIGTVAKNGRGDYIRVKRITQEGKMDVIDIREHYTGEGGMILPGPRGVRMHEECYVQVAIDFLKALTEGERDTVLAEFVDFTGGEDETGVDPG